MWCPRGLTSNPIFSTKSVYEYLDRDIFGPNNKLIWKVKIIQKFKFSFGKFLGMLFRREIICGGENGLGNPCVLFASIQSLLNICSLLVM
jgi:hypothetical protein